MATGKTAPAPGPRAAAGLRALTTLPLVLCAAALLATWNFKARPWLFLLLMLLWFAALALAVALSRERPIGAPLLLGVAAVLRLLLLPVPPTLSDDVYRYLWDGHVTLAGDNPYAHAPESDRLTPLRQGEWDALWRSLPHRQVETVYPPVAIGTFSIAAALPSPLLSWKLLLIATELLGGALLLRVAARWRLPDWRAALYLWNPLVVVEVAAMGHVDGLGLAAVAAGLLALGPPGEARSRPALAGLAAAVGVLVKLVPIVLLPAWSRLGRRPLRLLAASLLPLVVVGGAVVLATGGVPPGLIEYGVSWEYNGPIYEPLWRLLDRLDSVEAIKHGLDRAKAITGWHEGLNRIYPFVYPQLLAKLVLAAGLVIWIVVASRGRDPLDVTARLLAGAALAMATFYPWYLLWLLPWAALRLWRGWLLLSVTLPLGYLPALFDVSAFPTTWLLVWVPPLLVGLVDLARRRR